MLDFAYHGLETGGDEGMRMIRQGFTGIFGLLQYAAQDVHDQKMDALKTIYDLIQQSLTKENNTAENQVESYLLSCYQCIITNIH
jgi:hypothetical protein